MSKYFIRPHHMLCLQFFEGKGYSKEFVENMIKIHGKLKEENPQIEIVAGADCICENCPNRCGDVCENEESVLKHDKRVYEKVRDIIGTETDWDTITKAIKKNIIEPGLIKEVCAECIWSDICYNKNH